MNFELLCRETYRSQSITVDTAVTTPEEEQRSAMFVLLTNVLVDIRIEHLAHLVTRRWNEFDRLRATTLHCRIKNVRSIGLKDQHEL